MSTTNPSYGVWRFDNPQYQQLLRSNPGTSSLKQRKNFKWEPRFQIILACFLATLTAYVERTGFSIAYTTIAKEAGVDEATKGTVLSSFYWGYGISQIPGGWAAQRFGGENTLTMSFLLWSVASILTPGSADNTRGIITARVCVGIAQGFLIPAIHTVLSQWIPPTERARAVSLTTSGMYLGSAAAMQALPGVAARLGAPALLRVVGILGLVWLLMWRVTLRRMKAAKAANVMPHTSGNGDSSGKKVDWSIQKGRGAPTPWRRMARHPAVWAIVVNNFTFHYAFYVVMNWLPTYFDKVLHADLASLGMIKTLPYLTMFAASNAGGWAGDYLINVSRRSVAGGRKTVNTIGFWAAAAALCLMPSATGVASGVFYTTMVLGACGFARGGFSVNHMDIAPKFAGMVMGISNTAGTLSGVIGVAVTGHLLQWAGGAANVAGWYQAFWLSAVQIVLGSLVFLVYAKGERLFGGDATDFQVFDSRFVDENCRDFAFVGANAWRVLEAQANLTKVQLDGKNPVDWMFETAKANNISVIRMFATGVDDRLPLQISPGQYNQDALEALDKALDTASKNGVMVTLVLARTWQGPDSTANYASWNGIPIENFYTDPKAIQDFLDHITFMAERRNSVNGKLYKEDATIFSWNLQNEPRFFGNNTACQNGGESKCAAQLNDWIKTTSDHLKKVDPNHMIAIGNEGFFGSSSSFKSSNPGGGWPLQTGQDFELNSANPSIDYAEIHLWPDNWSEQDPKFATQWLKSHEEATKNLGKPLVMEEFGKNSSNPFDFSVEDEGKRRSIFEAVFKELDESLKSGGVLRGASYWMFDPSLQNANSEGFTDFGQDQVPVNSPTFKDIIVPAARSAAQISGTVEGCSQEGAGAAPAGRKLSALV